MKCFIENYQLFAYEQGEIFPSMDVIAFIYQNDHYEPKVMEWGLSLGKKRVINARIETVHEKTLFQNIKNHRCAIPCNCFYEWKEDLNHKKQRYCISHKKEELMYMAGLYDSNQFVILTGESQYQMKHLHDRTPLLMTKDEMYQYLRFAYDPIVKNKNIKIESVEEKKNR